MMLKPSAFIWSKCDWYVRVPEAVHYCVGV